MNLHEQQFINVFIIKDKRDRFLQFLKNPKGRKDLISELAHFKHLDSKLIVKIPGSQQNVENICNFLKSKGSPDECYVLSENVALDGKFLQMDYVIKEILGSGLGTIVSCRPVN
jgi:hypothetical protein